MKMRTLSSILSALFFAALPATAAPLTGARITHIVNDVKTVAPGNAPVRASVNDPMEPGKSVRTGIDSRTEMLFSDQTITRLGANSHFTVNDGTREISLSKGVILLQVPKGSGGARIQTNAVTAAITGTTIVLESLNGFKKLTVIEGKCFLTLRNDLLNHKTEVTSGHQVRFSDNAVTIPRPKAVSLSEFMKNSPLFAGDWGVRLDPTNIAAAVAAQIGQKFGDIGILKVKGIVMQNRKPAKDGDHVHSGDIIETSGDVFAIIIVTGGGQISIHKRTRARIGGGGNDPVTATAIFGKVETFGLGEDTPDGDGAFFGDNPFLAVFGFGNIPSPSGGGSSASGGVSTAALPDGRIGIFDSFGRFIRFQ